MRRFLKVGSLVAGFLVVFFIGIAIGGAGKNAPAPAVTITASAPAAPAATQAAAPSPTDSPTPAFTSQTFTFHGTGNQTTPGFTSDTGNYIIKWSYSGNTDPNYGQASNFIITEGQDYSAQGLPNDIQASGSGSTQVSGDPGSHYFNVQATGSWTVKVVTAP